MENQNVPDDKKQRKPLMEKKRRARINESLENLKQILLECDPQCVGKKSAKLEKADILEMTVSYLQTMRKPQSSHYHQSTNYGSYSSQKYSSQSYVTVSSKSGNVGQYCYGGSSSSYSKSYSSSSYSSQKGSSDKNGIWRPW
ncbi:transcription factor HES-5-like [Diabrotica virgifera virgifera]|uniref:Transcription factor HES-5-like n=1 Tax=Diabrotica virgifera virgifera TaxID=50390 RepID=A0A6P7FLY6_DIAVI|nr:transcription factor HES-5-like [Diabrotica virgifera virgifera]